MTETRVEISDHVGGEVSLTDSELILNFRRKSVVGLNFDFVLLNLTKHSSYMIYNVCLYFSPIIQKQYFDTYGDQEVMIPVAANDVAFSIHAVVLTALTLFQIFIYEVLWFLSGGLQLSVSSLLYLQTLGSGSLPSSSFHDMRQVHSTEPPMSSTSHGATYHLELRSFSSTLPNSSYSILLSPLLNYSFCFA
ncbi:hypothetical protein Bca101_072956 [Brassica carinata]